MRIVSLQSLSRHLRPLCSRDGHVMKYQSFDSRSNTGEEASYHCGSIGCSTRYNPTNGYFMLIGMPDHPNAVPEPGVNTSRCPTHGGWLYRRDDIDAKRGVGWCCGVEGCDYRLGMNTKGDSTRN